MLHKERSSTPIQMEHMLDQVHMYKFTRQTKYLDECSNTSTLRNLSIVVAKGTKK